MALVVLDASVVIGFLDPEDTLHTASVRAVSAHRDDDLRLPASAYAEILVAPHRAGVDAVAAIEIFLTDLVIKVEPITKEVATSAARLRAERRTLRLPDALVLATAEELGADAVLSGDASWAKISERVTVVRGRDPSR